MASSPHSSNNGSGPQHPWSPRESMAELLKNDRLTQLATLATFLLLFTSSKFLEGFGQSPSERQVKQHNKSLHYMMWKYNRDKLTSTNAIRLRFVVTCVMTTLWAVVFCIHSLGIKESVAHTFGGIVMFVFFGCLVFFEIERGAVKTKERAVIPVTIVTGWLGAGKTTMIKHLLQEAKGMKILVVENEAGSIGVDHELLVSDKDIGKEDVVLLRNGCVCCSVRADLGRVLKDQISRNVKACQESLSLFHKLWINYLDYFLPESLKYANYQARNGWKGVEQRPFDAIILETTGIALPSPIIQLFFADPEVRKQTRLDSVIAMVDGKHIWNHITVRKANEVLQTSRGSALGEVVVIGQEEVATQIAYADRVIINKVDLIEPDDSKSQEDTNEFTSPAEDIRKDETGKEVPTKKPSEESLDKQKGSLKNKRGLEAVCKAVRSLNPRADILKAEHGKVPLKELLGIKAFDLKCQFIPPTLMSSNEAMKKSSKSKDQVREALSVNQSATSSGDSKSSNSSAGSKSSTSSESVGSFDENGVFRSNEFARFHRSTVETFTIVEEDSDLDLDKFNEWIVGFLQEHGEKIYRLKGFIAAKGERCKLVFQGVHMTFTGEKGDVWASGEKRKSTLVVIGKAPLPRVEITNAFHQCAAK